MALAAPGLHRVVSDHLTIFNNYNSLVDWRTYGSVLKGEHVFFSEIKYGPYGHRDVYGKIAKGHPHEGKFALVSWGEDVYVERLEIPGVAEFAQALDMQNGSLETLVGQWISEQGGVSIKDVVELNKIPEFLDALPLGALGRPKAERYLASLSQSAADEGAFFTCSNASKASALALKVLGLEDAGLQWSPLGPEVEVAEVAPGSPYRSTVEQLFSDNGANAGYHVTRVRAVQNRFLMDAFNSAAEKLRRRRGLAAFDKVFADSSTKMQVLEMLRRRFLPQVVPAKSNMLVVWQGTKAAEAICRTGFAALAKLDDGFFCNGIYNTPDAEYACRYGVGEFGPDGTIASKGCLVMSLLVVGLAYPIDRGTDYNPGAPQNEHCLLKGRPLMAHDGYDTHVVAIEDTHYECAPDPSTSKYMEVVVAQESHLLPVCIVEYE